MITHSRLLEYIREYRDVRGYPPTIQEMADAFHTVKSVVYYHLVRMERAGLIERAPLCARAITIKEQK